VDAHAPGQAVHVFQDVFGVVLRKYCQNPVAIDFGERAFVAEVQFLVGRFVDVPDEFLVGVGGGFVIRGGAVDVLLEFQEDVG
jgi:hypothetical protein